ncbi:hypothetical protein GCM10022262_24900 [Georgenia daeguensis]|uniref:Uncharacterized protein n=1 Tax=Georgenia daeguensis TaxID=908355 RepID=A0ABP8EW24_9MICO
MGPELMVAAELSRRAMEHDFAGYPEDVAWALRRDREERADRRLRRRDGRSGGAGGGARLRRFAARRLHRGAAAGRRAPGLPA